MKTCRKGHTYDEIRVKCCPECNKVYQKRWEAKNPNYMTEWQRKRRIEKPEIVRAYVRAYNKRHPVRMREFDRIRRAREYGAGHEPYTPEQWQEIILDYNGLCAYCGKESWFGRDHIIPLSKGGPHVLWNLVPACKSCNSKKGTKTDWQPLRRHRYML